MRRVVITGLGTVNALAADAPGTFRALREGRCGIGPLTFRDADRLSIRIGAELRDWRAEARFEDGPLVLDVAFAFDNVTGGLICVTYSARDPQQTQALREWLTRRYGQPARRARDQATGEVTVAWREPDNIDLHTMPATRPVVLHCARGT